MKKFLMVLALASVSVAGMAQETTEKYRTGLYRLMLLVLLSIAARKEMLVSQRAL